MRLADRLRAGLDAPPTGTVHSGDRCVDDGSPAGPLDGLIPAAVLIAVTDRPEPGVILTVRRDDMRTHAGQIAFPGGRVDAGEDAVAAALREAEEELGLSRALVEPVRALDHYATVTGYAVTPVLSVVPADLALTPHDREVADWFEAPLGHLLDDANHRLETRLFEGRERHYYRIDWNGRMIWGATAAMIVNLSRRLRRS